MERPTVERYRRYLTQIYCFEAPVEAACAATEQLDRELVRTHLKTHYLAADLEALGLAARSVAAIPQMSFDGPEEALGWLWVVHRNTLVHGLVRRHLETLLPDTMRDAGAYLAAVEGRAGALMGQLGRLLDAAANRIVSCERIVAAAKHAFRLQHQWYDCELIGYPRRAA